MMELRYALIVQWLVRGTSARLLHRRFCRDMTEAFRHRLR